MLKLLYKLKLGKLFILTSELILNGVLLPNSILHLIILRISQLVSRVL